MAEAHDYLDAAAAKLKAQHPAGSEYISGLVKKYKEALVEGSFHLGDTAEEVISTFERDVLKYCGRAKPGV